MARGREEGEGAKGRTPVPDCESAKVATLKCAGPPTMPKENRGPWSKKFENRWCSEILPLAVSPTVAKADRCIDAFVFYTWGEVTSQNLWPRYDRHFVGTTWHNVWS